MEVNCDNYLFCGLLNAYIDLKTAEFFVFVQINRFNVSPAFLRWHGYQL